MKVTVEALVQYVCTLSDEDAQKVREYADEHCFGDCESAVMDLYWKGKIDLYHDSVESDFDTQECISVDDE